MAGGPGKAHREGISLIELGEMFPDEGSAREWFEGLIWPNSHRYCPRCGSVETREASPTSGLPYWCSGCQRAFSVRIGTALERSKVPFRKWVFAIYLEMTILKGVSSMKLHRDLKVTQKTAWFMLHRIREAWANERVILFTSPVEVDETYFGGLRKNMPKGKRKALTGRGTSGKTAVIGAKDRDTNQVRATVVKHTDTDTLQGFVADHVAHDAIVYTDDASGYQGMPYTHESVTHSVGEYVRDMVHTNGIESFWILLKRAHKGTFHKPQCQAPAPLRGRVRAGRHNMRGSWTPSTRWNPLSSAWSEND